MKMTFQDAINRGYNLLACTALALAGLAFGNVERDIHQRRSSVERHMHVFESQNRFRAVRSHQVGDTSWLVKIRVTKNVSTKISTDAITTACVVARPTPCVPPVARRP